MEKLDLRNLKHKQRKVQMSVLLHYNLFISNYVHTRYLFVLVSSFKDFIKEVGEII